MRHLRCQSFRLFGNRGGVAAIEFALILPLMLLMYMGTVDLSRGVLATRNLDLLSRTLSDITAQQSTTATTPSATISNILSASTAVMSPFATTGLTMTVSAVDIKADSNNKCCIAVVRWSLTQGGTLRACNANLMLVPPGTAAAPTNVQQSIVTASANNTIGAAYTASTPSYVIVADASYGYAPIFSQAANWFTAGTKKTTYMVPRAANGPIELGDTKTPTGQTAQICF